ncbi:hypothetical protein K438DRAFT_1763937 [Mycena galopus ATCC 62051]|nr:hypothetical protein K438DRAFT_1763937 [Mycena galopus ATCC 62051]
MVISTIYAEIPWGESAAAADSFRVKTYNQNHPSVHRLPVHGTAVLAAVRRRDGMLGRPAAQGRDGTIVRPSVRPTVLDGYGDDPYLDGQLRPRSPKTEERYHLNEAISDGLNLTPQELKDPNHASTAEPSHFLLVSISWEVQMVPMFLDSWVQLGTVPSDTNALAFDTANDSPSVDFVNCKTIQLGGRASR